MLTTTDSGGDLGDYIITELAARCGLRFTDTERLKRLPAAWAPFAVPLEGRGAAEGAIAHGCKLADVIEFCVSLLRLPLKTGDYSFDVGHGGGHFRSSAEHARIWFESSRVSMMITSHGDGVAIGFTSHEPA